VVTAAYRLKLEPYTWWFPIVGRVPYKGFYDAGDAERLAAKLRKRSLDVITRPVDAFSTLGFFRDPVYSFMQSYPVFEVASLVLHEETHATVYLKSQAQFNEELASFVGNEGALLYLRKRYGEDSELYRKTLLEQHDDQAFTAYLKDIHARLEAVYASSLDRAEKLAAKQRILDEERDSFAQQYPERFRTDRYRGFSKARINNAYLDLYATYTQDLGVFERLYEKDGRDLRVMMEQMRQLKDAEGDAKELVRTRLLEEPAAESR
jgi:predicted aminopeptidase